MLLIGKILNTRMPSVAGNGLGCPVRAEFFLVVSTLRRLKSGTETIRIISARQASRKEREAYAG